MTHGSYHSGIVVLARQIMVAGALPAHHSPGGHVIQAFMLGHISRFGSKWRCKHVFEGSGSRESVVSVGGCGVCGSMWESLVYVGVCVCVCGCQ